jgi:hypothetical protein
MDTVERMVKQMQLIRQAERLDVALVDLRKASASDPDRRYRLNRIVTRNRDRLSRREDHYRAIADGKPVVTTVQVSAWIARNFTKYVVAGGVDLTEVAGDACQALNLWDKYGSIPMWVYRISESTCTRLEEEAMRRRSFFVEKQIQYEPNGDVLWA